MRVALGMIIRSIESEDEIMRFVNNAEMHGHKLECVIAAYTQCIEPDVERSINDKIPFFAVDINNPAYCLDKFKQSGLSDTAAQTLLKCPIDTKGGLVPYGHNRTIVVLEAIFRGLDVLFFVDSDVYPTVLTMTPDGVEPEEVDFFGAHLEHLGNGSQVTTGEYSGYNILPPALFDGMEDLLIGLQKEDMLEYWQNSQAHKCLALQQAKREVKTCCKILGGNTAIKISAFRDLPPFFSSYYASEGEMFLCRGEDTVLGLEISKKGVACTDVGLNPLHDTYKDYPAEPNLRDDPAAQNRFYYACTGWMGRNPFLNYIKGNDLPSARENQRAHLVRGLRALSDYTQNPRYCSALRNFDVSWDSLGRYINEYERVLEAWNELRKVIARN